MQKSKKSTYNRHWLERELAKRCNFLISDAEIFLAGFEDIIMDIAKEHSSLIMTNLFKIYSRKVSGHRHWLPYKKEFVDKPDCWVVTLRPSKQLRQVANMDNEKNIE